MSRFEKLNNIYVNVDEIRDFYRISMEPEYLRVYLKNNEDIKIYDPKHVYENQYLIGSTSVKQVIPTKEPLYLVRKLNDENNKFYYDVERSNYLALCEDGNVYPLENTSGYFEVCLDAEIFEEYKYDEWKKDAKLTIVEYFERSETNER